MTGESSRVEARVARILRIGDAGTRIELRVPVSFVVPRAGQFVQIACGAGDAFRLRRPFSVCGWRGLPDGGEISILFSVVGEGSAWLDARKSGDRVDLIGPLGAPFRTVPGRIPILLGGGRGVAPMLHFADQIAEALPDGMLLYGARDAHAIFPTEGCPYPVYRSTLDGSIGQKGTVIGLLEQMLSRGGIRADSAALFGCGPTAMLEALSRLAVAAGIPVQVSLETVFGCGTGLCAGCAIPLRAKPGAPEDPFGRYAFACTDGPVFDGAMVDWEAVRE